MPITSSLKNINFMSQSKYDSITPSDDELYAVEISKFVPDYTAKITGTNSIKVPSDGWLYLTKNSQSNPTTSTLTIKDETGTQVDSLNLFSGAYNTTTSFGSGAHLRALKNYTYSSSTDTVIFNFYPDKE